MYFEERRYRVTLNGKLNTLATVSRVITPTEGNEDPIADYDCNCQAFRNADRQTATCEHIRTVIDWIGE